MYTSRRTLIVVIAFIAGIALMLHVYRRPSASVVGLGALHEAARPGQTTTRKFLHAWIVSPASQLSQYSNPVNARTQFNWCDSGCSFYCEPGIVAERPDTLAEAIAGRAGVADTRSAESVAAASVQHVVCPANYNAVAYPLASETPVPTPGPCEHPCGWVPPGAAGAPASCSVSRKARPPSFTKVIAKYPNLLTLHPRVDCDSGQYVYVETWGSSGMTHMHEIFNGILLIAMSANLTLVHSPRRAVGSHGGTDNDSYMYTEQFSVALGAVGACAPESNVRRNTVVDDENAKWWGGGTLFASQLSATQGDLVWAQLSRLGVANRGRSGAGQRVGFLVKFKLAIACAPYLAVTGEIYRAMYALGRAAAPHKVEVEVDEIRAKIAAAAPAPCHTPYTIGVHVRRGDIMDNPRYESWRLPVSYFEEITMTILAALPACLRQHTVVVVYTEGECCEFDGLLARARDAGSSLGFAVVGGNPVASFIAMAECDVLVTSFSGFSTVAAHYSYTAVVAATVASPESYVGVVQGYVDVTRTPEKVPVYDAVELMRLVYAAWARRCDSGVPHARVL